ncbi:ATP-grasp domain-containing protein [Bacillus swezeyi]|uniref:Carbamoyl-phosphate synthase large subunit n=1 Tax=Bacillus swezeyi TaxID=1925020 RepID=A0A1R1QZP0_9BACI|nr:ATP-grasp domain-containing protein [Bacillus swezeyi]MEC1259832.1 ATP-grasp domain-containing protein [Bacillus swezeyi]MED2930056.1 ATP-grasp domain-containing protein [Bacillus swezeyi]MED2963055.1 ATP-grasp domain-containing protein [Bacillus swezeyi]MED3074263.1 ATP-grasp domain-containing protein [Bacillus swezeyi]MED3083513.1 ATP-grasp domain-containing protein [Bacillus swezeyi]
MKKHILFFNATYIKKISTLETAKNLDLTVSVVGPELPEWSRPFVDHFICANTYEMDETIPVLKEMTEKNPFDGVITFWDRDVVPVAVTAQEFNLKGSPVEAAERARNKWKMRQYLNRAQVPHPKYHMFTNWNELYYASVEMEYPLIIKPVGASASKGVFRITKPEDLYRAYQELLNAAMPENDKMFSFYQNEYLVEEFMNGQEVSIEGVISDGVIHFAGVTEKWTDQYFEEYQHAFPARLSEAMERELFNITSEGIKALGLDHCGFHAEVMITGKGCKIIEINGRLGGDFITTHLVPLAKGIDITRENLLAVLGEKISFEASKTRAACVRFLIADRAGVVEKWEGVETIKEMPGVVEFVLEKQPGDHVGLPPEKFHDSRIAYVITEADDTEKAIKYAENALSKVRCFINGAEETVPGRDS